MAPLRCRALGHRFEFSAEERTMRWHCRRCPEGGTKEYASAKDAARYAAAFDRSPWHEQARRAPFLGLLPLRLARLLRQWMLKRRGSKPRPVG